MKIEGKVIKVLEVQTGEGKNGTWKKGGVIVETAEKYPKQIKVDLFNKVLEVAPKVGEVVEVSVNIESREFNSKWYTNISAWKVEVPGTASQPEAPTEAQPQQQAQHVADNEEDVLLF